MLHLKIAVFCSLLLQIDCHLSETKELCVNSSDVLWNSLGFWEARNIIKKWKIREIENLNEKCKEDMTDFVKGISSNEVWAIKMLDSNGHYSGGLFNGKDFFLGSNTQCQHLQHLHSLLSSSELSNQEQFFRRTYENRVITNLLDSTSTPFPVKFTVTKLIFKLNSFCLLSNLTERIIYVGLCLPSSCGTPDVRTALEWAVDSHIVDVDKIRIIPGEYNIWDDKRFYILSCLFFTLFLLMSLGTILEVLVPKSSEFESSLYYRTLHAFSIPSNLRIIMSLKVGDDTLAPIHGLKFISMVWVLGVHCCLILFQVAGRDGILGHIALYISMCAYRILRLSFPYLITVILVGFLAEQHVNNSPLFFPGPDHITCTKYWWRNALYINTFYPIQEMCMNWSWYLANDTQLFVLGVPLLILALHYRLSSFIIGSVVLVISWITTAVISYRTRHLVDVRDPFADYDDLYDKPWMRLGPYFIGLGAGWFLYNNNCSLKLPKRLAITMWLICLSSMILLVYGPLYFPTNAFFGMIITTFSHTVWSTAISWVLIACVTNNGYWINEILSWKYMYPFSRVSYCVYLIHPMLMRTILLSSDIVYFISVEILAVFFFGFLILSIIFGTILSLAFESPIVALLRLGHDMRKSKK